ncbi:MAG: hypothetical protein ACR2G3_10420 [Solirubrobacterales bacterium]
MSLYRQAGGSSARAVAIGVAVALVVGAVAGYLVGRGTAPEPTLAELVAKARQELRPALSALELVGIEYSEAVGPTGEVRAETELDAAGAQAQAAADALAGATELEAIDPEGVAAASELVGELEAAIAEPARTPVVEHLIEDARARISALVGDAPR